MRIAVDTGGTFTDCVWVRKGRLEIRKVFSTPRNPAEAVLRGVEEILGGARPATLELHHGTTVGTNALLERSPRFYRGSSRRGGRVALVTTVGFEDVIEIGRQARPQLYNLFVERPPTLVPARLRFGVRERVAADGRVLVALSSAELRRVVQKVARSGAEAVAVCLLFSFLRPAHERRLAARLRKLAINKASKLHLMVCASHEILPEFREYERTSTVVVNAYLLPRMGRYLTLLEEGLRLPKLRDYRGLRRPAGQGRSRRAFPASRTRLRVMQSSGGIISARVAAREPVRTILSGPAGGVVGAQYVASCAGFDRIISFDMGGTSTDVSLVDGAIQTTKEGSVGDLPVAVPMVDVHSVGAGGGSLARFDAGGALRVGPESAGADPGPICYGHGEEPTVTDAHLLLGRLDPEHFLGGEFRLHLDRTRRVFARWREPRSHRGRGRRRSEQFAQGIIAVANATMEKAIRIISVERGHDPRRFTLVAFGGAGGLHACELAGALRIPRVLIPKFPGGLSALGILRADPVKDFSRTVMLAAPMVSGPVPPVAARRPNRAHPNPVQERIAAAFASLEAEALRAMRAEGFSRRSRIRLERALDLRYVGQAFELTVPVPFRRDDFVDAFHRLHEQRYGYADRARPVEIVNVRLRAIGFSEKPELPKGRLGSPGKPANRAIVGVRTAIFSGGREARTPFYDRARLRPGNFFSGPAIIVEYSATTVLPPGWRLQVDAYENLILEPLPGPD